eukprot:TRINITY_DN3946_c0_g1_i3.p1 TRINITY_DN3946_c0_g1~~TRINITY_DN3946_c0_g1_i3.p1  ORF type:complete len:313 (+),score=79.57 TRINITY_DN3946_c0_g1_i3:90-1028(+)
MLIFESVLFFFFLMIRRPPRSTQGVSSAASDVYKRQTKMLCKAIQSMEKILTGVLTKIPKEQQKKHFDDIQHMLKGYQYITDENKLRDIFLQCKVKFNICKVNFPRALIEYESELGKLLEKKKKEKEETHDDVIRRIYEQEKKVTGGVNTLSQKQLGKEQSVPEEKEKELPKKVALKYERSSNIESEDFNQEIVGHIYIDPLNIPTIIKDDTEEPAEEETKTEGKGERREETDYSNWCCSNADPEDLLHHRELMDRMHFQGPLWKNHDIRHPWDYTLSVPEEKNPNPPTEDPDPFPQEKKEKSFEKVVRQFF